MSESGPLLQARSISKHYGAVHALTDLSLDLYRGEVVALVGDNGAGKSTLAGILSGTITPTSGELRMNGEVVSFSSSREARDRGIEMVFQDLALAPDLTVAENMYLGRERIRGPRFVGWLDRKRMNEESEAALERLSIRVRSVRAECRAFSGGQRQAVAIARAVTWSTQVLLLDEPTAALGVEQQDRVASLIREAAAKGLGVLVISHNIQQVLDVADRVVVLYHGRAVADLPAAGTTVEEVIGFITGASVERRLS